ncbi:MAG: amidohydrolase [Rikenellaceae bacterium]
MTTLFYNAQVLTMTTTEPTLMLGAVGVVGSHIALVSNSTQDIERFEENHPNLKRIDCEGKILMPGLINTHTHVAMTLQRGMGDDVELMPWLQNIVWPFEALQNCDDIEAGARLGVAEMLLGGTTTFVDMYWSECSVANAVEELGIRALLGESCLDGMMDSYEQTIPKLVERASKCSRITAVVAPHAPYTCSPETLKRCVELAQEHNLSLMIHLAETSDETNTIRERYEMTPTEYLDKCGMLTPSTILSHSIYLSDSDIEMIESRGSHVAHNPQCNMKISSGVAPIPTLIKSGVNCTIGTDGVCSNNDLDMWDEMRTASFLHKLSTMSPTTLPAYEILKMATVGGAKAIGREGELGITAEGALADLVVLNTNRIHYRPHHDLISSIVYCGKASDVEYVMVDGALLVEKYQLVGVDVEAICCDVEQRSANIIDRM